MSDMVNHPPHYTFSNYEVIDVIEEWNLPFHLANTVKYIARAGKKGNEIEDLEKALWYLNRYINWRKKTLFVVELSIYSEYTIYNVLSKWKLKPELSEILKEIFEGSYIVAYSDLREHVNELKDKK